MYKVLEIKSKSFTSISKVPRWIRLAGNRYTHQMTAGDIGTLAREPVFTNSVHTVQHFCLYMDFRRWINH